MVEELIWVGVVVNLSDKFLILFIIVCKKNNLSLVEVLIKLGVEVNLSYINEYNLLIVVCFNINLMIVNELIKVGVRFVLDDENK